jgi:hypothetical protein
MAVQFRDDQSVWIRAETPVDKLTHAAISIGIHRPVDQNDRRSSASRIIEVNRAP